MHQMQKWILYLNFRELKSEAVDPRIFCPTMIELVDSEQETKPEWIRMEKNQRN